MGRALFVLLVAAVGLYFLVRILEVQSQEVSSENQQAVEESQPDGAEASAESAPPQEATRIVS